MEPGQKAYETWWNGGDAPGWDILSAAHRARWAAVEAALVPPLPADVAGLVERLRNSGEFEVRHAAADAMQAQAAEIERLLDLFRIDGEQHAMRIREMEKAHDARVAKYYKALEAERAKLREAAEIMAPFRGVAAMLGSACQDDERRWPGAKPMPTVGDLKRIDAFLAGPDEAP